MHCVFKDSSSTTKVRTVFDALAKTSNNISLNETLETGPNLYPRLEDVLIRYHPIGLTVEIGKMFREILLSMDEQDYHRFLIREENGFLADYCMKRLTWGEVVTILGHPGPTR